MLFRMRFKPSTNAAFATRPSAFLLVISRHLDNVHDYNEYLSYNHIPYNQQTVLFNLHLLLRFSFKDTVCNFTNEISYTDTDMHPQKGIQQFIAKEQMKNPYDIYYK